MIGRWKRSSLLFVLIKLYPLANITDFIQIQGPIPHAGSHTPGLGTDKASGLALVVRRSWNTKVKRKTTSGFVQFAKEQISTDPGASPSSQEYSK